MTYKKTRYPITDKEIVKLVRQAHRVGSDITFYPDGTTDKDDESDI